MAKEKDPTRSIEKEGELHAWDGDDQQPAFHPSENVRRVYALPQEMVDRIVEFQKEKGLSSEVEAVRRLLDEALKSRDDLEKIINRYLSKLYSYRISADAARDVLVGHPLVHSIEFERDDVKFLLKSGQGARISERGLVAIIGKNTENLSWESGKKSRFSPGQLVNTDVPF